VVLYGAIVPLTLFEGKETILLHFLTSEKRMRAVKEK